MIKNLRINLITYADVGKLNNMTGLIIYFTITYGYYNVKVCTCVCTFVHAKTAGLIYMEFGYLDV